MKNLPAQILAISALLLVTILSAFPARTAALPPPTFDLGEGLQWGCMPYDWAANASNVTSNENVSWVARWNCSSYEFEYYQVGHGTNFVLEYADGFVAWLNENTTVEMNGQFPYPCSYSLEPGLSLHGNAAPIAFSISEILALYVGDVAWAAIYNATNENFDYYFPATGQGVDFDCPAFAGIWFYVTGEQGAEISYPMGPN